ncbi:Imm1 family immunity protein [Streptomyces sp. NPDC016845]|uniref:Imm1 family immunity protein n=1 Tax=Streptomyces sp. NPDC016845 TaxID=3364972 RepID=UPI0037889071
MIVELWVDGEMRRVSTQEDAEKAINEALTAIHPDDEVEAGIEPNSIATLHVYNVAEETNLPERPENSLTIGVNRRTGFGGMTWWGEEIPEDPTQFHWVSATDSPPELDPRVIADPWHPLWYGKYNCIPMKKVEMAVAEFWRSGGKRPTIVNWEPSTANGESLLTRDS